MKELHLSRATEADLLEIWSYWTERSPRAADRIVDAITDQFTQLCEFPSLGRRRAELGVDCRSMVVGEYIIVYRVQDTQLEIVRVVHGSRDLSSLFAFDDTDV